MSQVEVIKLDHDEKVMVTYTGKVLRREENFVVLEAFFNREDMPFLGTILKKGDRFVETFFNDRWYNIFEIYDRDDGTFKGWYCNVGRPAVFETGRVSYVDLALDLWVDPNGAQTVLDEDEFMDLPLDESTRASVLLALEALRMGFENIKPPV